MRLFFGTLSLLIFSLISTANAGLFDDLKKQAEKAVQDGIKMMDQDDKKSQPSEETTDKSGASNAAETQSSQKSASKAADPKYDTALVRQIQQELNGLGYNSGTPDGIYGSGTRKAIEAFQSHEGLQVDGQPSQTLLAQLKGKKPVAAVASGSQSKAPQATKTAMKSSKIYPEPSIGGMLLAYIHFNPGLIDKESELKRAVLYIYPDKKQVVNNEFEWHKQKDKLKQSLLKDAKNAQLIFDVLPWRRYENARWIQIELQKYDFEKSAYWIRFAIGSNRPVSVRMFTRGVPASKYVTEPFKLVSMDADKAEKIANSFGKNQARRGFLRYRLVAIGAAPITTEPLPIVEFAGDKVDLYAQRITHKPTITAGDFEYIMSMPLPMKKPKAQMAAKSTKATSSSAQSTNVAASGASKKETTMDAMLGFTVDGLGLNKSFQEMKTLLEGEGYNGRLLTYGATEKNIGEFKKARAKFSRELENTSGKDKDQRQVFIEFKNGKPKIIQYTINTPAAFDSAAWVEKLNGALGEAMKTPCVPSDHVQCKWQVKKGDGSTAILLVVDFDNIKKSHYFVFKRRDI